MTYWRSRISTSAAPTSAASYSTPPGRADRAFPLLSLGEAGTPWLLAGYGRNPSGRWDHAPIACRLQHQLGVCRLPATGACAVRLDNLRRRRRYTDGIPI